RKIAEGETEAEATFLAAAGLARLGIDSFPGLVFRPMTLAQMVPAAGQAAIALQCRAEDFETFSSFLCARTAYAVNLERAVLAGLGGGCHTAVGVHASENQLHIYHHDYGRKDMDLPHIGASQVEGFVSDALTKLIGK
ncbi:MAG: hypothetical protein AAF212_13520, partial [Verrucomicrobiota bacterium]